MIIGKISSLKHSEFVSDRVHLFIHPQQTKNMYVYLQVN